MTPSAVLLTGPVGVGKTVVAQEIVELAEDLHLGVAAIDLDWLGWATGATIPVEQLISRNLAALAATYAAAGVLRLVLTRALTGAAALHAVAVALPRAELTVVRLQAARPTLEDRLRRRDSGAQLDAHLAELDGFQRQAALAAPDAAVISNDGRPIRDVALDVMRTARWVD